MQHRSFIVFAAVAALGLASCGADDPGATATFASPADGASIAGAVAFEMTAEGVMIEPAGEVRNGFGHFHVIADAGCVATGTGIGKGADHVHFGVGQTDGVIYLEPGAHELCLQVGDGGHGALDITDTISVEVGVERRDQWCSVIGEIDTMFDETDIDDDFAAAQVSYENIRRLVAQARSGIGVVDPAAQSDISITLGFANDLAVALSTADDPEAAEAAAIPIFDEVVSDELPGAGWVLEACGVDIGG